MFHRCSVHLARQGLRWTGLGLPVNAGRPFAFPWKVCEMRGMTPEQLAEVVSMQGTGYIFTIERPDGTREEHCRTLNENPESSEEVKRYMRVQGQLARSFRIERRGKYITDWNFYGREPLQSKADEVSQRLMQSGYEARVIEDRVSA